MRHNIQIQTTNNYYPEAEKTSAQTQNKWCDANNSYICTSTKSLFAEETKKDERQKKYTSMRERHCVHLMKKKKSLIAWIMQTFADSLGFVYIVLSSRLTSSVQPYKLKYTRRFLLMLQKHNAKRQHLLLWLFFFFLSFSLLNCSSYFTNQINTQTKLAGI